MRVDSIIRDVHTTLNQLLRAMDMRLTLQDNMQCKIISVPDSGGANVDIDIEHKLGKVPTAYIWNIDRAGIVYDQTRASWTTTEMTLRCSVANAALVIVVF